MFLLIDVYVGAGVSHRSRILLRFRFLAYFPPLSLISSHPSRLPRFPNSPNMPRDYIYGIRCRLSLSILWQSPYRLGTDCSTKKFLSPPFLICFMSTLSMALFCGINFLSTLPRPLIVLRLFNCHAILCLWVRGFLQGSDSFFFVTFVGSAPSP